MSDLPALDTKRLPKPAKANSSGPAAHPPRFLLLYGSVASGSLSHFAVREAARLLEYLGGETRIFDPAGLPLPQAAPQDHPKVAELRELLLWSESQIWCSPEYFGTVSAVMKAQIDWSVPVIAGAPTFRGKPLGLIQICGAGPTFNTVLTMATIGRWLQMLPTPAPLCIAKAQELFEASGRMKPSAEYDRLVDLVEELYRFTLIVRGQECVPAEPYSKRK